MAGRCDGGGVYPRRFTSAELERELAVVEFRERALQSKIRVSGDYARNPLPGTSANRENPLGNE
jgi:hypothetical protein